MNIWTEAFTVRTHEADSSGQARLDSLFSYFQEAAGRHAAALGAGREQLLEQGCFWVLSRCWMRVQEYPAWGRDVVIRTWPRDVERLFALRDFQLLSPEGRFWGDGISAWLILDSETHRPVRPKPFLKNIPANTEPAVEGEIAYKMNDITDATELRRFAVRHSDLDVNRHVNNAAYVRWILDAFSPHQHDAFHVQAIRIDYLAETVMGRSVAILAGPAQANHEQLVRGVDPDTLHPVFQAALTWKRRKTENKDGK
jgi:medium-chain acyl-[acyl-carrier-protein] hydrolase